MDPAAAARFAGLALKCLHDEYPNHISLSMDGDADARPPRELTPAFYGCYDWHLPRRHAPNSRAVSRRKTWPESLAT
jgi:hypothetical protein